MLRLGIYLGNEVLGVVGQSSFSFLGSFPFIIFYVFIVP